MLCPSIGPASGGPGILPGGCLRRCVAGSRRVPSDLDHEGWTSSTTTPRRCATARSLSCPTTTGTSRSRTSWTLSGTRSGRPGPRWPAGAAGRSSTSPQVPHGSAKGGVLAMTKHLCAVGGPLGIRANGQARPQTPADRSVAGLRGPARPPTRRNAYGARETPGNATHNGFIRNSFVTCNRMQAITEAQLLT
jgi:hypothetical protein